VTLWGMVNLILAVCCGILGTMNFRWLMLSRSLWRSILFSLMVVVCGVAIWLNLLAAFGAR
jgi:hypothetical protein